MQRRKEGNLGARRLGYPEIYFIFFLIISLPKAAATSFKLLASMELMVCAPSLVTEPGFQMDVSNLEIICRWPYCVAFLPA